MWGLGTGSTRTLDQLRCKCIFNKCLERRIDVVGAEADSVDSIKRLGEHVAVQLDVCLELGDALFKQLVLMLCRPNL